MVSLLDLCWLVVADNDGVVSVPPGNGRLIDLQTTTAQIWDVNALVVLLVHCLQNDLLLLVVDFDNIVVLRVREVPDPPFKPLVRVFPDENRVRSRSLQQVLLRVELASFLANLVLPRALSELTGSFPLAKEELISGLVAFFDQLSLIREQIVQLSASVANDFINCRLAGSIACSLCL